MVFAFLGAILPIPSLVAEHYMLWSLSEVSEVSEAVRDTFSSTVSDSRSARAQLELGRYYDCGHRMDEVDEKVPKKESRLFVCLSMW